MGQGLIDHPGDLRRRRRRKRPRHPLDAQKYPRSTSATKPSRPTGTASRCWTSTTCSCTPPPPSRTTPRWPPNSATATDVSSSTSTRMSPPLQQRVLEAWLGRRDDLTVVGDANQTIYSFTGASPATCWTSPASSPTRRWSAWNATTAPPAGGVAGQPGDRRRIGRMAGSKRCPVGQRPPGPGTALPRTSRRGRRGHRGRPRR